MAKLPKEIQEKIKKKWFPESHALDTDRGILAKDVYSYKTVEQFNKWKKDPSRSDLRGFDTPDVKESSIREVLKKISGRASGEDVLLSEPERFTDLSTEAGRMLLKYKDHITNFDSFKKAVEMAWSKDGDSIKNLYDSITKGRLDSVLKPMFESSTIQGWLKHNRRGDMVNYIMKKYRVSQKRATRVFDKLTPRGKDRILKVINSKQPKINIVKIKQAKKPRIVQIRQLSKSGTIYKRTKPSRWDKNQIKFIESNKYKSLDMLLKDYNNFFKKNNRTISSLRNKIYRMR